MKTAHKAFGLLLAFGFALTCGASLAQSYPSKPIRLIVGYVPGGGTDTLARIIGQKMTEHIGQPVRVENKPGANATIGTEYVAKSAPDGYTLLVASSGEVVDNVGLYDRLPYDPVKDFLPITMITSDRLMVAVHPSFPGTSTGELIALAKAKSGQLFYAAGAPQMQVAMELFKKRAGANIVYVPFKGTSAAITAAVAGEVQMVVAATGAVLAQLRAGRLRGLAVTGSKRSNVIPDVPTFEESGARFDAIMWWGVFAPAGTSRAIIDKLYDEISIVLKDASVKERFASFGYETNEIGMPPAEFGALFRADLARQTKATREANIRAQ